MVPVSDLDASQADLRRLSALLDGVRRVNRLITREEDPRALIRKACTVLVETQGLLAASIVLVDDARRVHASATSGQDAACSALPSMLQAGDLPVCMRDVLREPRSLVLPSPCEFHPDCRVSRDGDEDRDTVVLPLRHAERLFGVLWASAPTGAGMKELGLGLMRDVSDDLAFALDAIAARQAGVRADQELQATRELLSAVVCASPVAIFSLALDGRVTSWNRAAGTMFGWSAKSVHGKTLPIVPPEQRGEFDALRERVAAGEVLSGVELERRRRDGTTIHISLSTAAVRDDSGRVTGIVSIAEDITERKLAASKLRASEERFRATLYSIGDGVMMTDAQGVVQIMNPVAESLTGWTEAEARGRPSTEIFRIVNERTGEVTPSPVEGVFREGRIVDSAATPRPSCALPVAGCLAHQGARRSQ